jgi:hypothetical protein
MQINRVFDFIGPSGFIPNGVNYKYTSDMWDCNFYIDNIFIDEFNKKYLQIAVYDCNLNIGPFNITDIHIFDLRYDEETNIVGNPTDNYFYTITPFGNVLVATGQDFTYHQNQHVFDFISERAKQYLKAKNFYLIFDYSSEGDIKPDIFYNIHTACETHNICPSKVIFITSAVNTTELYTEYYVKDKNPKFKLKTTCYPWPFFAKGKETVDLMRGNTELSFNGSTNKNSISKTTDYFKIKNRKKKCLMLNRRLRPHRLIILSLLQNDKLLDSTLSSFDMKLLYTQDAGLDLVSGGGYDDKPYLTDYQTRVKMSTGFHGLTKIKKQIVDYDDIESVWGFAFETKKPYEETYFSIVPETLFYEAGNYISEKTLKPIAHLHPFVMLGRPHILKKLKKLGFKTFSDFWDESYDDIENNSDRIIAVYEIIKKLILVSNEEWDIMISKMAYILEHNRTHLMKFNDKLVPDIYVKNLNKIINGELVDLL